MGDFCAPHYPSGRLGLPWIHRGAREIWNSLGVKCTTTDVLKTVPKDKDTLNILNLKERTNADRTLYRFLTFCSSPLRKFPPFSTHSIRQDCIRFPSREIECIRT